MKGTASKPGGGSWAASSDRRVKKNVQSYTKGLKELLQIRPVSFQYSENNPLGGADGKTYVGVIAQEMRDILPSTVTELKTDTFDDLLTYDSSEVLYTIINAIIKKEKDDLEAENEALKAV